MEISYSASLFDNFNTIPLISKLLANKYRKISYFISLLYAIVLVKLKLKSLKIQPVDYKLFCDLLEQNAYNLNFAGDIYSCGLISINTLIALSIKNNSWIKISKSYDEQIEVNSCSAGKKSNHTWKIIMPPVNSTNEKIDRNPHYYIQCVCLSSVSKDFILYVTDLKLFNISRFGNKHDIYSDFISEVKIESSNITEWPMIAKSVVVAAISTNCDFTPEDYECMLNEHFKKPKLVIAGDIFEINLKKYFSKLKLKTNVYKTQSVYFRIIKVTGDPKNVCFVLKGCTSLFLDPPVNGYIPQKTTQYIQSSEFCTGVTILTCPNGLHKYYMNLRQLFVPFIKYKSIEARPMFLLSGPKGSGKEMVLRCVAASFGLHIIDVKCFDFYGLNPSLVKGKLNQVFMKAKKVAPCVIFLEKVEFIGREQNYQENTRLLNIFETCISSLWVGKPYLYPLFVVGSTSAKSTELIPSVHRLFVETIEINALKYDETFKTLEWLIKNSNMSCSTNIVQKVAERVKGYVYADLVLLVDHALSFHSADCLASQCDNQEFSECHFDQGIEIMEAAYSDSIGAARVPKVHWEDIGGLADLKEEIMLTLNLPLKHPELFSEGLKRSGLLFYGPPGTGKTLLAKAVATECNYNFLSVKGPELMNMYVGQSEKNVREVFDRARDASPCIIFFDELDSLAPVRGKSGDSGGVMDRVVSQLLAEMDGLDSNKNVFVLAATNRPDLVDPALLRPGRFDKMFYVGMCTDNQSKLNVLTALTRKFTLNSDVDFEKITAALPKDVTGADLYSISSNAWLSAARRAVKLIDNGDDVKLPLVVTQENFLEAVSQFVPSLTVEDIQYFEKIRVSEDE